MIGLVITDYKGKVLKMGRTQLQDAVPMTLGQEFNSFASTIAADLQFLESVGIGRYRDPLSDADGPTLSESHTEDLLEMDNTKHRARMSVRKKVSRSGHRAANAKSRGHEAKCRGKGQFC